MSLTAEKKIERAHFYIMNKPQWVAYSGVIMVGKVTITDEPITARTDGYNIEYGREFIDSLSDQEVRFVVLHENLHKMWRHVVMWRHLFEQDFRRANISVDNVVNLIIDEAGDAGVKPPGPNVLPGGICMDKKYTNWDAGKIFRDLPPTPPCPGCGGGQGSGVGNGQPCPGGGDHQGSMDEHDWPGGNAPSPQEQAARAGHIDNAIRQGAILAGKMAGNKPRGFDELMEVPIDWKEVLRQFVQQHCRGGDFASFRRPNRRYLQYDMVMPSTISETIDSVLIACDTSGSIQGAALTEFVSAMVGCLEQVNPARTDLLYWDHVVAGHEIYFQGDAQRMKASTSPQGGGGTTPSCITDYMAKHNIKPTCAIVLTDGWVGSDWGNKWPCPVLWVIKDNKAAQPTTGPVVHF